MSIKHQRFRHIVELVILAEEDRLRKLGVDVASIDFGDGKVCWLERVGGFESSEDGKICLGFESSEDGKICLGE